MGIDAVIARARAVVGDGPTYVSFDVDSLDPAFAPGTGTPEVGGLTPREALAILRGLAGIDIVGGDVVEVAPQYDANTDDRPDRRADAVRAALPRGVAGRRRDALSAAGPAAGRQDPTISLS